MTFTAATILVIIGMFVTMLAFIQIGKRIGAARLVRDPEGLSKGTGPSEAAVFGMLGLIIAFTFSGAASRFEARRHLVVEEVNAIGTAYLRIQVIPEDAQPELRSLFARYLDLRLKTYSDVEDQAATKAELSATAAIQETIWKKAVIACQRPDVKGRPEALLLPALNAMFDITTTRTAATMNHPPLPVFMLLAILCLVSSVLTGYGISANKRRSILHTIVFATITSVAIFVILDLEFPRLGLIRVDNYDQLMIDMRKTMN